MNNLKELLFDEKYGTYYLHPFVGQKADDLENHLLNLNWETKRAARHEYFMSDLKLDYSYGGDKIVYNAKPFTPEVRELTNDLNRFLGTNFNACFLNKYDDEKQHLGWHADDFAGMDNLQPIAVISFGAEREIWVKEQNYKGVIPPEQRILLNRGSLFIMPPGYQDNFYHKIPKNDRPCGWRISLTFRSFK